MRHDKAKLIIDIFLGIIIAISVLLAVIFYIHIPDLQVSVAPLNTFLYWAYLLLIITVFFAFIVGPINGFIQNPKTAIKGLIAVVVLAIIVGISASLASSEPTPDVLIEASASAWRWADILLYTMYILGGLGFLAIIASELKALFH